MSPDAQPILHDIELEFAQVRSMRRRVAGLRLAARAIALSHRWEIGPEGRTNALIYADRMLALHGPVRPGWMTRVVAEVAAELDRDDHASEAMIPGSPSVRTASGWMATDLVQIARAVLAPAPGPLQYSDEQARQYLRDQVDARR